MNAMKPVVVKGSSKQDREYKVLLGLVDYYLKTGRPVGSNSLKEAGFGDLSSATIRNYFAHLEEAGYLMQQHTSGGRIPTNLAFRTYAKEYIDSTRLSKENEKSLHDIGMVETREIAAYLQKAAETLSNLTHNAVFLSAPRFDHDFIVGLKLVPIDATRCVCVIVTDFGIVQTEVIHVDSKMSAFTAKRIESYFHWRLTGHDAPENIEPEEEKLAQEIYNELMLRYLVGYSNFIDEELYRTGFSKLLEYPDFHETSALASSLALFENVHNMRLLVRECCKLNHLKFWIGDDLATYSASIPNCAVIAAPYHINQSIAGAIGILGPVRMPYQEMIGVMRSFAENVSKALTRNIFKFKINFRQPHQETKEIQGAPLILLENKGVNQHGRRP
jgi:heat-inducible transcriptional repressor